MAFSVLLNHMTFMDILRFRLIYGYYLHTFVKHHINIRYLFYGLLLHSQ